MYDVIIIGSGPAGLTAAIYATRANLKTLIIAGTKWGGQLQLTTLVENFPGFPDGIQGPELMSNMRKQAERFGTEIIDIDLSSGDFSSSPFKIIAGGKEYLGKSIIIATGADAKWLGVPGEKERIGRGVSTCAPCDGFFFKNKNIIVVGGGDSAMEEAIVLTNFASSVTVIHRREEFRASEIMLKKAKKNPKIKFLLNSKIVEILGKDKV
ncbi:MAG: FAD-dependent oxidoreductase, partial [Candidatus Levybacteria bacterium]|nr:FAD-dependent oxidoreductase [Candidatus Levybacteria bacterium]